VTLAIAPLGVLQARELFKSNPLGGTVGTFIKTYMNFLKTRKAVKVSCAQRFPLGYTTQ